MPWKNIFDTTLDETGMSVYNNSFSKIKVDGVESDLKAETGRFGYRAITIFILKHYTSIERNEIISVKADINYIDSPIYEQGSKRGQARENDTNYQLINGVWWRINNEFSGAIRLARVFSKETGADIELFYDETMLKRKYNKHQEVIGGGIQLQMPGVNDGVTQLFEFLDDNSVFACEKQDEKKNNEALDISDDNSKSNMFLEKPQTGNEVVAIKTYFASSEVLDGAIVSASKQFEHAIRTMLEAGVSKLTDTQNLNAIAEKAMSIYIECSEHIENSCEKEEVRRAEEKRVEEQNKVADVFEAMDPYQFEEYIAQLLRDNGYHAETTRKSGDYGADVIATAGWDKIAIQVKKYSGVVGTSAIKEIISGMRYYGCNRAWAVTNSHFTESAKELAAKNNVELYDREKLIHFINITGRK